MAIATVRRRVSTLEGVARLALISNAPPLTLPELEAIVRRLEEGDGFTGEELRRMERHGAICHGESLITVFQGELVAKRYIGVDASQI
jgi:hypothetical protein